MGLKAEEEERGERTRRWREKAGEVGKLNPVAFLGGTRVADGHESCSGNQTRTERLSEYKNRNLVRISDGGP